MRSAPLVGFTFALICGAWAAFLYMVSPEAVHRQTPHGPLQLALIYLLAGQVGALVWALAYPVIRWRAVGYVLLGVLAASPLYLSIAWFTPSYGALELRLLAAATSAVVIGGAVGWFAWRDVRHKY